LWKIQEQNLRSSGELILIIGLFPKIFPWDWKYPGEEVKIIRRSAYQDF